MTNFNFALFRQFIFTVPNDLRCPTVLSRRFVLFQAARRAGDLDVQVGEFDWATGACSVGEITPFASLLSGKILLDRSYQDGNLHFLYYYPESDEQVNFWHCRVNCEHRRVERIDANFQRPNEMYTFMDFHDGILRRLSSKELTRFDVRTQQMLAPIPVHGLPLSFFSGSRRNVSFLRIWRSATCPLYFK
jgi:hypothetical protein